jgi:hypothetical protein
METTATQLREIKTYKIGSTEEEGIAASITDLIQCECCGRKIANVTVLNNGLLVGSECAGYLTTPIFRHGRKNKKADTYLAQNNYK